MLAVGFICSFKSLLWLLSQCSICYIVSWHTAFSFIPFATCRVSCQCLLRECYLGLVSRLQLNLLNAPSDVCQGGQMVAVLSIASPFCAEDTCWNGSISSFILIMLNAVLLSLLLLPRGTEKYRGIGWWYRKIIDYNFLNTFGKSPVHIPPPGKSHY